jgi:hypothetical protein
MSSRTIALLALLATASTGRAQELPHVPQAARATPRGCVLLLGETASAEGLFKPERAGESLVLALDPEPPDRAQLVRALGGDPTSAWIVLTPPERLAADDSALAARVRSARHVALAPAPLLPWLRMLYPRRSGSALLAALREALDAGACLAGREETAVALAAAGVVRGPDLGRGGEVRIVERNPRKLGEPRLCYGAAFVPGVAIDTAARSGDRLERLCASLADGPLDLGVYLSRGSVLAFDAERERFESRGEEPLLVIDVHGARTARFGLEDARLSLLARGARWDGRRRRVVADSPLAPFAAAERTNERAVQDVFAIAEWLALGERARAGTLRERWTAEAVALSVAGESDSLIEQGDRAPRTLSRLRLSIELDARGWDAILDERTGTVVR